MLTGPNRSISPSPGPELAFLTQAKSGFPGECFVPFGRNKRCNTSGPLKEEAQYSSHSTHTTIFESRQVVRMIRGLLFSAVCASCSAGTSRSCKWQAGVSVVGFVLATVEDIQTQQHCGERCSRNPYCAAATHSAEINRCTLHSNASATGQCAPAAAAAGETTGKCATAFVESAQQQRDHFGSWSMGSLGNALTGNVCGRHGHPHYCWLPNHMSSHIKMSYRTFWEHYGPELRSPALPKGLSVAPSTTVVHFRCGDIMARVNGDKTYYVPAASCVVDQLSWLGKGPVEMIVGGHMGSAMTQRRCSAYVSFYKSLLRRNGNSVTVVTGRTLVHDWVTLSRAKKVLALIPSSFSMSAKANNVSQYRLIGFDAPHLGNTTRPHLDNASWWKVCERRFRPQDMTHTHHKELLLDLSGGLPAF